MRWSTAIFLGLILLIFCLPFRERQYTFDWDQTNDYEAVETIAEGKLRLIGPRVTSDQGFFLAPWHYYYLLPFYKITGGSLYMGFWGALVIQYFFVLVSFVLVKKWFGSLAGMAVGIMAAVPVNLTAWGFMYVPLLSLLFFYFCLETLKRPKLLPWLFLFFGFGGSTYAVFYALGIPFLYVMLRTIKKVSWRGRVGGVFMFFLPYLPLMIFDIRHNFLNIKNMLGFAGIQNGQGSLPGYFITVFFRAMETMWLGRELPQVITLITILISIATLIFGIIILFKKEKLFVFLWLISSLVPMSLYRGNVSEYYYAPVTLLIPIFISGLLIKRGMIGRVILSMLVIVIVALRFYSTRYVPVGVTLADKIEVVRELDNLGENYSVSYDFDLGEDSGYNFIFKKMGENFVEDGSAQLYTITYAKGQKPISGEKIFSTEKLSIYKR